MGIQNKFAVVGAAKCFSCSIIHGVTEPRNFGTGHTFRFCDMLQSLFQVGRFQKIVGFRMGQSFVDVIEIDLISVVVKYCLQTGDIL